MPRRLLIRLALALLVAGSIWISQQYREAAGARTAPAVAVPDRPDAGAAPVAPALRNGIGFRDAGLLHEHYRKHGAEFGGISEAEYLRRAQLLRDRAAGGDILEAVRTDGVVTRFDRSSGAFLAFDRDLTIRTFFQPNDGERYFMRQLARGRSDS